MKELTKKSSLGGLISKGAGIIFGSKKRSLLANAGTAGATSLLTSDAKMKYNGVAPKLNTQGKGFKMVKQAGLVGLKNAVRVKKIAAPKSGLGTVGVSPTTSPKSILAKSAGEHGFKGADAVIAMGAGALGLKGVDKLFEKYDAYADKKKFDKTIAYAKSENPELKKVPDSKLKSWMNSFYTLSHHLTNDKGIATSMLSTVNNYGGDIDLATAKLIAETGHRSKRDHKDKVSDPLRNSSSLLMG